MIEVLSRAGALGQLKKKFPADHPLVLAAHRGTSTARVLVFIQKLPPESLPLTSEQIAEIVAALAGGDRNGHR